MPNDIMQWTVDTARMTLDSIHPLPIYLVFTQRWGKFVLLLPGFAGHGFEP
jgi:hypothetical protein